MRSVLAAALLLLLSGVSSAYVRSRTPHGTPTHWTANCVQMQPDSAGTPDLADAITFSTIQASVAAWKNAVEGCAYMTLDYIAPAPLEAHFDGTNTIKFRTDKWCHPDDAQSSSVCYSAVAAGITTVFYADRPGQPDDGDMLDADVELNNVNFTFAVIDPAAPASITPRNGTSLADLENTLVHELGHVQGLDHTCKDSATPSNEVDENSNPPPACATLAALPSAELDKIVNATMYNSAEPGETKKRSPEADDVAGICNAYPIASDPKQCSGVNVTGYASKGCDVGAGGAPGAAWPTVLMLGALAWLRRRRRA